MPGKFNRSRAHKALNKSEGKTTKSGGSGHARGRHAAPTTDAGPSIDAYLISRCDRRPVGTRMSAFVNDRDQDRAVAYALGDSKATVRDSANLRGRKTVLSRVGAPLNELTVRVAEVTQPGHAECYNAKLRAVTVVYDDGDTFVTAYPSDFHA
jgi:hypothetical protein